MKFSTFVLVFVAALYNETKLHGRTEFTVGEIMDRYGLAFQPGWLDIFFNDYTLDSYVDARRHLGPVKQQRVSLTAEGTRWVEKELGENLASFLEQHGARYGTDDELDATVEPIDSAKWTGLPSDFTLTEQKREALVNMLGEAERTLDGLGADNSEKAMARAYIVAARALADTPEPPVDLIWEIIGRANSLAGIASLFVSIIALFAATGS